MWCRLGLFFETNIFNPKMEKMGQIYSNLLKNSVIHFFFNLVSNETLYYLLYSCTDPIFWKYLIPKIWAKTFLTNQIALLKSAVSIVQNCDIAYWYNFIETKSWLKSIGVGMVKKRRGLVIGHENWLYLKRLWFDTNLES